MSDGCLGLNLSGGFYSIEISVFGDFRKKNSKILSEKIFFSISDRFPGAVFPNAEDIIKSVKIYQILITFYLSFNIYCVRMKMSENTSFGGL